ncbi:hypothetical protein C7T94_07310 [Pedobacter yulinensis]|uniref:Uncharacterized protein n=1 Tax=Pedobacter yulinensis TaxID=2126353 RepID=A0A2T3HJ52_9SPHI|nr:hypothetical protein C7T94_07310 [Pedobacter yulinensis]
MPCGRKAGITYSTTGGMVARSFPGWGNGGFPQGLLLLNPGGAGTKRSGVKQSTGLPAATGSVRSFPGKGGSLGRYLKLYAGSGT